jgi:hypothetical protein
MDTLNVKAFIRFLLFSVGLREDVLPKKTSNECKISLKTLNVRKPNG